MVACAGYAALGNDTPFNILTGFTPDQVPYWVIDMANIMVLIHMIPGGAGGWVGGWMDGCVWVGGPGAPWRVSWQC
jgi:hypothetical protein